MSELLETLGFKEKLTEKMLEGIPYRIVRKVYKTQEKKHPRCQGNG